MSQEPIVVRHDPEWASIYRTEAAHVSEALELDAVHHIGSTAIPGIYAKPVIDMLGEAEDPALIDSLTPQIELIGYEALGEFGIKGRRYFRKDIGGVRKFHLHVFPKGSDEAIRHLRFRDFMIARPFWAKRYSDLKQRLVAGCEGDIEKFIDGKDGFIKDIDRMAGRV